MKRCLISYEEIAEGSGDYLESNARKFFGTSEPPAIPYAYSELEDMALNVIKSRIAVPGVQPKLSLDLQKPRGKEARFTLVGLFGKYILKPPVAEYPELPELEDLTMHLATFFRIKTVPHCLIKLASGELSYLSKRIDRSGKKRIHMEDMAQLLGFLTEDKYKGSAERIAKAINSFSSNPGLDQIRFLEILLFSFLTGNADMHLKNFSLIYTPNNLITLAPAYDLVPTALVIPDDPEEMAIPLNGKKSNLKKSDFEALAERMRIPSKSFDNLMARMKAGIEPSLNFIEQSFLSPKLKISYQNLIKSRATRLF